MKYCCTYCNKCWNHPVEKCIFCGNEITQIKETQYKVVGFSEVFIPSTGNEKVPYYVNILEDGKGDKIIKKSFEKYEIGDTIDLMEDKRTDMTIGVIGTGLMGIQIASYLIQYHYPTTVKTRAEENASVILSRIQKQISKRLTQDQMKKSLKNLHITTKYEDLAHCDIIIEAVIEDLKIKKEIFNNLSKICGPSTIFASNSSSLSIDDLSIASNRPEKCIGMHFFNPVHRMDLVEVVVGKSTSETTINTIKNLVIKLNKRPIVVKNSPGYVVNRLLLPQINEAIHLFENGVASKEDIDNATKLGLNHPMGPFELADFIGLDICLSILEVLHRELHDPHYKPAKLLYDLVNQGKLGFKSGEGFYLYGKVG